MHRIHLIISFIALISIQIFAQSPRLDLKFGSDALVEDAIKGAIVMVESNYCIEDVETHQKYGRNGKSYFNIVKFLGCKTDKGIIIGEQIMRPWDFDSMFEKYKNDPKFQPLLDSVLTIHPIYEHKTDTISIASSLCYNNDSTIVFVNTERHDTDVLMVADYSPTAITTNWLVWLKKGTNDTNEESDLGFTIVKKKLDLSTGVIPVETPNPNNPYYGGLYITAKTIGVGLVEFTLAGFIIRKDSKWVIVPLKNDIIPNTTEQTDIPDITNPDDSLTPVIKSGKNNKPNSKASKKK